MNENKLVKIAIADLPKLRNLYLTDWPSNMVGYYTLDNFIRWFEKEPNIKNLHFYSLNDDWKDGTFFIVDRYQLFMNSLSADNERLSVGVKLLDWNNGLLISTLRQRHRPPIDHVITSKSLTTEFDSITRLYYLPRHKAQKLTNNIPLGFSLRPLSEEHAEKIDTVWPNRHHGSLFLIKRLIAWNANVGLFKNDDNELVAWSLRLQAGVLGVFQVDEIYKRKGYGSIVLKAISQILALADEDTCACVNVANIPSVNTFEKVGFECIDHCYWIGTHPLGDFLFED